MSDETKVTKRCETCGRFRAYDQADSHCILCGSDTLSTSCVCSRGYDYALMEEGDLHCPRCGRVLRGGAPELGI